MNVGDLLVGWFSFFTDIPEGWNSVTVPVHVQCRRPFRTRRWLSRAAWMGMTFLVLWLFGDQIEALLPDAFRNALRKIAILVILMPALLFEALNPPAFDLTFTKYYITFEFADIRYAAAFAKINDELKRYEELRTEMGIRSYEV